MPDGGNIKSYGNYKLIAHEKANGLIDVCKYKSTKTGVTVVIAQVEGPVVNGYFVLGQSRSIYWTVSNVSQKGVALTVRTIM